jgi:hypothetical protein
METRTQATRGRKLRWVVAIAVVTVVTLVSAAGVFFLSGGGGAAKSLTAGNAPQETLVFVDFRTDLPGDQHQKLADFMTHFPGFKDRAQFENAFDELLNRVTSQISPELTYTSAFKAWTSGEISIAVTDLGLTAGLIPGAAPQGALIVSLKDRDTAEAWVASEAARRGLTFTASTYAGTTLHQAGFGADGVAYALTDRVLLAGNIDAVKAGLDAPASGSLAELETYQTAMGSLSGDHVAAFYMDPRAILRSEAETLVGSLGPIGELVDVSSLDFASAPAWAAGSVRAESDRMTAEIKVPKPAEAPLSGSRESVLTRYLPGSTAAMIEVHSLSEISTHLIDGLVGQSSTDQQRQLIDQIAEAVGAIGGVDWIGDMALLATADGSGYGGGLVVKTPDADTAATKKALFSNLGVLADATELLTGVSVSQSEWEYKGTSVSRLTIAGLAAEPVTLDLASHGDLLIVGYGEDFMKQMLDTTENTSLAAQDEYRRAMGYAGLFNSGMAYADLAAIVDDMGRAMFSSDPASYDLNIAPYLENLSGAACSAIDGQTVTLRIVVTAR